MAKFAVAVINGTQARFFSLDSQLSSEYESGPYLSEHESLNNHVNEVHGQDLWANTKTGRNRGSSGQAHAYDDHRQNHEVEFERKFASKISNAMVDLIRDNDARQLILVAEPQILGLMRESMTDKLFSNLHVSEVAKDICQFSVNQIHDYLAKKDLLPACHKVYSR
jgi:protein required for attachment to host cells